MDGAGWLSSLLTATSRYHPTRTSSARPRAAFSSLMFMRTDSAAWAWRASMQTTGRPVRLSSCQSQLDIAPVSRPTRSALGAFLATTAARTPGSDFTRPWYNGRPASSTMQIDVSFCDTSSPTYCFMAISLRYDDLTHSEAVASQWEQRQQLRHRVQKGPPIGVEERSE